MRSVLQGLGLAGRNLWPVSIVVFFAVAIAGCVGFVAFCNLHPSELVSADYYEQELEYQGQIDRADRAREFGILASITYEAAGKTITIALPVAHAVGRTSGKILLYRASQSALDQSVALKLDPQGIQKLDVAALRPGLWKVKVTWKSDGKDYYLDRAIKIEA